MAHPDEMGWMARRMPGITLRLAAFAVFFFFLLPVGGNAARVAGEDKPVSTVVPSVQPPPPAVAPVTQPAPATAATPGLSIPAPALQEGTISPSVPAQPAIPTAPTLPAKDSRYITIDFDNVDIQVFVKFISEFTGKNFIIDDAVKGKVTIISPRKISVDEAYKVFESVLEVYGFTAVTAGDVIKILPAQEARERHLETRLKPEDISPEDRIVTQIVPLEHASPDDMKKLLDPMISKTSIILSYPPTGMLVITDLLSNIKKLQEIVGALDVEGVGEQISFIPMQHADSDDIVKSLTAIFTQQKGIAPIKIIADTRTNAIIVAATEMDAERVKKLVSLMDKEIPKGGASLHVYRLQNATAEDIAKVLTSLPKEGKDAPKGGELPVLSKEVQVSFDKATNSLIITAGREDYQTMEDVIKKLDVPRPMVYIEALIMEVNVNKDFKVGVEWRGLKDTGHVTGFDGSQSGAFVGFEGTNSKTGGIMPAITTSAVGTTVTGSTSLPSGFSLGIIGAGIKIGDVFFPTIGAVLQAYQTDTDVSILSTPQILTLDNEEAEINVGENVPYLTRQEKNTTGVDYSNYEYRDVGVYLKITPHISEEGQVRLKIDQQVTKVVSGAEAALPTTLKRTAKTTVVVKDQETVVIGGLVGDSTEMGVSKVPFFGDIPLLGWLFKTKYSTRAKTNLFVFLTPHVIRTQADASALTRGKRSEEAGQISGGVVRMREKKPVKIP